MRWKFKWNATRKGSATLLRAKDVIDGKAKTTARKNNITRENEVSTINEIIGLLRKNKLTAKDLSGEFDISVKEVNNYIRQLRDAGISVYSDKVGKKTYYYVEDYKTGHEKYFHSGPTKDYVERKILLVSDTHLNSKHHRRDVLEKAYDVAVAEDIDMVFHCGDWQEGNGRMYPGQLGEINLFGYEPVLKHVIEEYPYREGITTYGISGNHDESWLKQINSDMIRMASKEREDIKYLGLNVGDIVVDGIHFRLLHPDGGGAYARSYALQKYIRNLMPDNRPDVLVAGHLHTYLHMNEQGIECIMIPSMQESTEWLLRKGIQSQVGFVVLEYGAKDGEMKYCFPRHYSIK